MRKPKLDVIVREPYKPVLMVGNETLRAIRDDAIRQHNNISKTIAELEEMSNEINATLAFLKARRGDSK